jgi:DNA primase
MSDTVEQIKSRLDIVDVISGYLKVQKAGINHKARCPFHNEKTPSFYISPERQSWHCFGCNKGGDMFSFVQEIEGVEFVEAMRILAAKAGVQIPQYRPELAREKDVRAPLLEVAELSAKFFEKQLWNGVAGAKALAYLRERGLTDETIKAWRLGWAPNDWRALTEFVRSQGYPPAAIVGAGMAIEKNDRQYDRFRSRIMFPIADANSQVVGFTGRVFGAEVAVDGEPLAKYVNTPQTVIYDKSRILFGLDKAKLDMRRSDVCVLVEGNMDAIMSWQAGATNVVATSGTALTPHQLRMLSRYSTNLNFCFDTDQAGQAATRRGIGLALSQGFSIKVTGLGDKECKDPADYVKKYGVQWNEAVASAKPVLQFYYDAAVAGYNPASAESKKAVLSVIGPLVNRLTSNVEKGHWIAQVAALLRADVTAVQADLVTIKDDIAAYERGEEEKSPVTAVQVADPLDPQNLELLAIIAKEPALVAQAQELPRDLVDPRVAEILDTPSLLAKDATHASKHLVDMAYIRAVDLWYDWDIDDLRAELSVLTGRFRERRLRQKLAELTAAVQHAEARQDAAHVQELIAEFTQCSLELNRLQRSPVV